MSGIRGPKVDPVGSVAADAVLWRKGGRLHLTVVAKAAFRLVPEAAMTPLPPEPIHRVDAHHGGLPSRSARVVSDLAPIRHRADVLLSGHAQLGEDSGGAVRLAVVRGDRPLLDKRLHVVVEMGGAGTTVPLVYERAYGGPGFAENPSGTGREPGSPPAALIDPSDPHEAVGFGPIAASWPARAKLVPAAAREAIERTLAMPRRDSVDTPIVELPDELDWAYFQAAPPDQRIEFLQGDEWVLLDGVVPNVPKLRSRLPSVRGVARAEGLAPAPQDIALDADALIIDADRRIATVVFRGLCPVADPAALSRATVRVAVELGGRPVEWPSTASRPASAQKFAGTVTLDDAPASARLPFRAGAPGSSRDVPAEPAAPPSSKVGFGATMPMIDAANPDALPFHPQAAPKPSTSPIVVAPIPAVPEAVAASPEVEPASGGVAEVASPTALYTPSDAENAMNAAAEALPKGAEAVKVSRFFHHVGPREGGAAGATDPAAPTRPGDEPPPRTGEVVPYIVEHARGRGPLSVATVPWEIRHGVMSLTTIVKATCDLVAGGPARIRAIATLPTGDAHVDGQPKQSLLYASDFVVFKQQADVTLTGYAHAADPASGKAAVRFSFGSQKDARAGDGAATSTTPKSFERTFAVYGARTWEKRISGWVASEPEPFDRLRISYENAYGGPGFDANPVGIGYPWKPNETPVLRVPHLESSLRAIAAPTDSPPPVGFGGIAPLWRERWGQLGKFDKKWLHDRWPYLPDDTSLGYFQAAPKEQRLDYLVGDEPFSIAGMHPVLPVLEGTLPKVRVRVFVRKTAEAGGMLDEVTMRLDTAQFDVDTMCLNLNWRGLYEVTEDSAPEVGVIFVIQEGLHEQPATLDQVRARLAEALAVGTTQLTQVGADAAERFAAAKVRSDAEQAKAKVRLDARLAKGETIAHEGREKMRAAGYSMDRGAPPKPDLEAIASRLRASGMPEAEVSELVGRLADGAKQTAQPAGRAARNAEPNEVKRERVKQMLAAQQPLDKLDLAGVDFSDIDFTNASLLRTNLRGAVLRGCVLRGAKLSHATFIDADLTDSVLDGALCELTDFSGATLEGCSFAGARLENANLSEVKGQRASFKGATGRATRFSRGDWSYAVFQSMQMPNADFSSALLDHAIFDSSRLPDVRFHQAKGERASFKDAHMHGARADGTQFPKTNFKSLDAPGSIWNRARLDDASFAGGLLARASFYGATLRRANLSGADLVEARFDRAELLSAVMSRSNLMNASFQQAEASDVDFRSANLYGANTLKARFERSIFDLAIVDRMGLGTPK